MVSIRWRGPIFDWSSYAALARGFIEGLAACGVGVAVAAPSIDDGPPAEDIAATGADVMRWLRRFSDSRTLPTVIAGRPVASDGFDISRYLAERTPSVPHAMFTRCLTDRVSPTWVGPLNDMDAVWVPSQRSYDALAAGGVDTASMRVVEPGVWLPPVLDRSVRGADESFRFLSIQRREVRDRAELLVAAFVEAFDLDPGVSLTVAVPPALGGTTTMRSFIDRQLTAAGIVPSTARIHVVEQHLAHADLVVLLAEADAFVRVSSAEGWGHDYVRALASGLPVVATRWGGHLDYLDDDTASLVDCEAMVPIPGDVCQRFHEMHAEQRWAEPSKQHLVQALREVRGSHGPALERAERGRQIIRSRYTPRAAGLRARSAILDLVSRPPRASAAAADMPASVVWRGIFHGAESFAVESRDYAIGLHESGVAVGIEPMPGPGPGLDLGQATLDVLRRLRRREPAERWVHVQHATPPSLEPDVPATATVARTMFETEGLPDGYIERCNAFTEVWLPSTHNAEMFVRHGLDPAKAQVVPEVVPSPYFDRAAPLHLPNRRGRAFLAVFDWQLRKGWDVLLRAYAKAFSAADDVSLHILTHSMLRYSPAEISAAAGKVMRQVRSDRLPTVEFIDSPVPEADMPSLFRSVDAYVLPTRGEGWGRPFAAAMASGIPTIATDAGGQRHFMTHENSWLIPSRLVEVSKEAGIERGIYANLHWFEPDQDALVEILRLVADGADERRVAQARVDIEQYRLERVMPIVVGRIDALLGGHDGSGEATSDAAC